MLKSLLVGFVAAVCVVGSVQAHEHKAPHHGALCELGDEVGHLEFLLDGQAGSLTAYSLDGEAENPVRLSQRSLEVSIQSGGESFQVSLGAVANVLSGERVGDTSEFSGSSAKLRGLKSFTGRVALVRTKGRAFRRIRFEYP